MPKRLFSTLRGGVFIGPLSKKQQLPLIPLKVQTKIPAEDRPGFPSRNSPEITKKIAGQEGMSRGGLEMLSGIGTTAPLLFQN